MQVYLRESENLDVFKPRSVVEKIVQLQMNEMQ